MSTFADHFSGHAADYRTYRPTYPPDLFRFLASAAPGTHTAWDCATGSGQAAVALAEHFEQVIATDASANQLAAADPHPRVEYRVGPAEMAPLADASVDLVTVAQALHWFDFDRFYAEVRRVVRPGGLVAVWCYEFFSVGPAFDRVMARLESEFVGPYWPPERVWVGPKYHELPFPFAPVPTPPFAMTADWDLGRLVGYLNTWSATKRFITANGFNPFDHHADELMAGWGEPAEPRPVRWPLHLRVGRVD